MKRRSTKKFDRPLLANTQKELLSIMAKQEISQGQIAAKLKWPNQVVSRALKTEQTSLRALAAIASALGYQVALHLQKSCV